MYLNKHKALVGIDSCYVVMITHIPVDRTDRRMEGNLGM
jgi:hypothetical protein